MIGALRTFLFNIVFYGLSVPIVLLAPVSALFGRAALRRYARGWVRFHRWVARATVGLSSRVDGTIPRGQFLFVAKHQAFFETFELMDRLDQPVIVLKRELADIPVWGWVAQHYGALPVEREASSKALRAMLRDARAATAGGRSVLIFAEGTRVAPGEMPPLRSGFAGLYRALDLPVVAIATDSGTFWPKKGVKKPGCITFRVSDPIPPGLDRATIEAQVHAAINALEVPVPSDATGSAAQG